MLFYINLHNFLSYRCLLWIDKDHSSNMLLEIEILTCINQTASSSPLCIPLKIAAPSEDMYSGSSTGGVFSSKVSLQIHLDD